MAVLFVIYVSGFLCFAYPPPVDLNLGSFHPTPFIPPLLFGTIEYQENVQKTIIFVLFEKPQCIKRIASMLQLLECHSLAENI